MDESGSGHGGGSAQAPGTSLLDAHDHTRLWLQSKLSGDWSAQAGASGLTEERLTALSRCFGSLDSMVKVRLLLAGLFVPRQDRSRLQPLLAELASQAAGNQDEWVRATAAVVGDYSGLLDMRALMALFPLVRESVLRFSSQLADLHTPPSLLPQTEQYMHQDISRLPAPKAAAAPGSSTAEAGRVGGAKGRARPHFRLREIPPAALGEAGPGAAAAGGGGAGGGGGGGGGGIALLGPGGGSGSLLLPGLGSGVLGGAGSLGLDSKGSLSSGGPSGESLVRRGLSAAAETSMLRSRADVLHGKDSKAGPPTPSVKSISGPPGLALRLGRSRSLVVPEQLPVPESPHAGTTPSAAAAGTPAAAWVSGGALAAGTGGPPLPPSGPPPLGSGPSGAGAQGLSPLPQLHIPQAGPGISQPTPAPITRRDSTQGGTPRSSWQGGAATTPVAVQQYPLAAAIAFAAAAAASGDPLLSGSAVPFHAGSTAGDFPVVPHHERDADTASHGAVFRRGSQGQDYQQGEFDHREGSERGGEQVNDDGYGGGGAGVDEGVGRRPSQGFEQGRVRQGSGGEGGGSWQDDAGAAGDYDSAKFRRREDRASGAEPEAKRPRAGE